MNQREYYRLELTVFCSLRLRKLGNKFLPPGETFEAEIQNISGGGLCFLSERDLPLSDVLAWQFIVDLPDGPIEVIGQLVWKRPQDDMFLYGVKFVFFEEYEQRDLIARINELQIKMKQRESLVLR